MLVLDHVDDARRFVEWGLWRGKRRFGPSTALGFADDTGFVAGIVYHDYDPDTGVVELSAYSTSRDWLTRDGLRAIFAYPFEQLGVRACVSRQSEKNKRTIRIWRAFGASTHTIPELRGQGEAEVIAVLTHENWLNSKFMR